MSDAPGLSPPAELVAQKKSGILPEHEYTSKMAEWAHYYGSYISGFNPAVLHQEDEDHADAGADTAKGYSANPPVERLPALGKHVCALRFGELPDHLDFKYLANFCNRHVKCRPGVCLKVDRRTQEEYCKAGAPWPCSRTPCFMPSKRRRSELDFVPVRNDPLVNNIPTRHFLKWRANTDMKPVFSQHALEVYLTKYLTKVEVATDDLGRLTDTVIAQRG